MRLILKKRKMPVRILMNEVLERRLPENHNKYQEIQEDSAKRKAGFRGEQNLDYFLSLLPQKDYWIINDVRLRISNRFFQIDSLVVTSKVIVILEVKNINGTLLFDNDFNQFIRTQHDREERYQNPLFQTQRQKIQLYQWLEKHQFQPLPIEDLIVISNPTAVLKADKENPVVYRKVTHLENVIDKIKEIESKHQQKHLDKNGIQHLCNLLISNHQPAEIDILSSYGLTSKDLMNGVQCPECSRFSMVRKHRTWFCPNCKIHSRTSHKQAIMDYLLVHHSITNRECREFLGLHSNKKDLVTTFLKKMELPQTGNKKDRIYHYSFS
ncbi:nuclease-related domain-containing protein [Pseudalkalibacillus caeni]|uniref:NERD domain-containing protein n=1 Tax=Exobacillus caeni TaxID=2574798 RepID=A0A5R9EXS4_9BACL|nr:nuclease-related domain-containing protein [Pseudalkalibacillus caeni]TLS36082.1 NERD domain-containing protein [Pseudalkalibacillus caeni]